jgi:uncharacterized delta-60 repeat protein
MKSLLLKKQTAIAALMFLCFLATITLHAQTLDNTFVSPTLVRFASIYQILEAPGGKLYLHGQIEHFDKIKVGPVVRLTAQGTLDKTFKTSLNFYKLTVDRTGAIIGTANGKIIKLKSNGAVGKTVSLSYPHILISALLALPDGRLLVGTVDGKLTCYSPQLTIDPSFRNSENFVDGRIETLALQGNKIIISGQFNSAGGIVKNDIARIDKSGIVDRTFDVGSGTGNYIAAKVQADSKIYFRGPGDFNGQTAPAVMRLNPNGTLDKTFHSPDIAPVNEVFNQGNKIILIHNTSISRLNANGSIDQSFPIIDTQSIFLTVSVLTNGDIIAGNITTDESGFGIEKFKASGQRINSFRPPLTRKGLIKSITTQGENIIIAGDFLKANDVFTKNIARLTNDGSVDPTFVRTSNYGEIIYVKNYADQSLLVASSNHIEKLTPQGLTDESFSFSAHDAFFDLRTVTLLPDEKVFVMGFPGVGRLNSNGSVDDTFDSGTEFCCAYHFDRLQSDGKIIIASEYTSTYHDQPVNDVFRINTDGTLDDTFTQDINFDQGYLMLDLLILNNDDIIVSGSFFLTGSDSNPVFKIRKDGGFDSEFQTNITNLGISLCFSAIQFRDKIVLATSTATTGSLLIVNLNGTLSEDITIPTSIVINPSDYTNVWSPDAYTLYVMGNIATPDSPDGLSLVRLKYNDDRLRASTTGLNVYPNPADDYITIDEHKAKLTILSLDGNVKLQTNIQKAGDPVNISNLPRGRYVLKVVSENKTRTINFIKN